MSIQLARVMPTRLRHQSRVLELQCRLCGLWVKPRHFREPAGVCRDCEATTDFQTWKPTTLATSTRQPVAGGVR